MRKIVTQEEHNEWVRRYLAGETVRNIAKDYPDYHENTIAKHIKKEGVSRGKGNLPKYIELKPIILKEYQEDKFATFASLARKYNISDRTIAGWINNSEEIKAKHNTGYISKADQQYFKNIDTPSKAYLLGFITADGAVTGRANIDYATTCSIEVHQKDIDIIKFAQQEINPEASITYCNYDNKENVKISFNGKELCEHLAKYGIVKNKSKIIKEVPYNLIPQDLLCYYFRGLIDGDGCVHKDGGISIYSGSEDFIKSVQEILCKEVGLKKLSIYTGTTYFISWHSKEDRIKLYNYLYKDKLDKTFYYVRKYERLYNSLYGNTVVTD